jgi:hypothetical protein
VLPPEVGRPGSRAEMPPSKTMSTVAGASSSFSPALYNARGRRYPRGDVDERGRLRVHSHLRHHHPREGVANERRQTRMRRDRVVFVVRYA